MELNLAANIREMRRARGITQTELAQSLSVTPQSVSRWETGQAYPDVVLLPRIAKYFDVSLDELMLGLESSLTIYKKELNEASKAVHSEDTYENRKRVCDILEILVKERPREYLVAYFTNLMALRRDHGKGNEGKIENVREQITEMLKEIPACDRYSFLLTVIRNEDEDKLDLWRVFLPESYNYCAWNDYILQRYSWQADTEKWESTRQRIIYELITKLLLLLITEPPAIPLEESIKDKKGFMPNPNEYYRTALNVLDSFPHDYNDILLPLRIQVRFGLARALFWEGKNEEGFECLEKTKADVVTLWDFRRRSEPLRGSAPFMDEIYEQVHDDTVVSCILNIWKYDSCLEFDAVREDKRFIEFFDYINGLFPNTRSFIVVKDTKEIPFDKSEFDGLVTTAKDALKFIKPEDMTQAVVFKTSLGNVYHTVIQNTGEDKESDKLLAQMKKNEDTHITEMVCVWHEGSVDLPSYDLRVKLLSLNPKNKDSLVLLQGLEKYIVKELDKLMPPKKKN